MSAFDGVILTGGSTGHSTAFAEVDGLPVVLRVARALSEAASITAIGGDAVGLSQLGLEAAADEHPGGGPVGGIAQSLSIGDSEVVVVLACDMPYVNGASVRELVEAVGDHDAAVATVHGHRQPLLAAWRRTAAVAAAFAAGERSPALVLDQLDVVDVPLSDARIAARIDPSEDLDAV